MADAIKAYWWNDAPNFGDALSPELIAFVTGKTVEWANNGDAELFALGSILIFARRGNATAKTGKKPVIWGSGTARPIRVDFVPNVDFAAIRGPITGSLLDVEDVPKGDPGLLVDQMYDGQLPSEKSHRVGIVQHHALETPPSLLARIEADPSIRLINAGRDDALGVVQEIAACDVILSTSLHGIITADALNIANAWLDPMGIHSNHRLKFYDYGLSVGRVFEDPFGLGDIDQAIAQAENTNYGYFRGLDAIKSNLAAALKEHF